MTGQPDPGPLIFLHGASSAGKTTLARAVLGQADRPFWHLSIDHLRDSGVWDMPVLRQRARWRDHRAPYFDGFHAALAAILQCGNAVLLEHILETPGWHADLQRRLSGLDVFFVALHTPRAVLERRETIRGDRPAGSALADFDSVHVGRRYDLELDGTAPARDNARILLDAWALRAGPSQFFSGDAP